MSWPATVFDAPLLRGLDSASRDAVIAAGRLMDFEGGQAVYRENDSSDAVYVVVSGAIALSGVRRGDEARSVVRTAARGDTFGEEATLAGIDRRLNAEAVEPACVAEIPVAVLRRVLGRHEGAVADRERRLLERSATRDLLSTLAFTRDLEPDDLDLVLDSAVFRSVGRGGRVYFAGDRAEAFYLIVDGLVQLQTDDEDGPTVRAYLTRGDFFGDEELLSAERRAVTAVAMGDCQILRVPGDVFRSLSDRNPGLLRRIRRIAKERGVRQADAIDDSAQLTQHVFKDLYRMQMARSMLVIDQETCVRCGHCAWSCAEVHGVSRLVRRGDKVLTRLNTMSDPVAQHSQPAEQRSLGLPNSCQHCKNPACMIDCPTGAIGRDPEGEVFIREDLCTGCGNCAKACPWENIRMAPRTEVAADLSEEVAVKCDLCREYEAPACVQACPTESIFRLEPTQDFAEVSELLGAPEAKAEGQAVRRPSAAIAVAAAIAAACGVYGWISHARGELSPAAGVGLAAGWAAAVGVLALALYTVPKRVVSVWMKRRAASSPARTAVSDEASGMPRSRVRGHFEVHIAIGLLTLGAAAGHAGTRAGLSTGGALGIAFWTTVLIGGTGALFYRWIPRRLAKLERRSALPEDLAKQREALFDRLYRSSSGASDLVKKIVERVLVPYARSGLGPFELFFSGRSLAAEQARLRAQVDKMLDGRGGDRLSGLDELIKTVVELRTLPIRRVLSLSLRSWLPLHMILTGIVLVLLVLHVASVVGW